MRWNHRILREPQLLRGPVFLHIPKTGGTSLEHLLEAVASVGHERLGIRRAPIKLSHSESVPRDWPRVMGRAAFSFVYRDPAARYRSAFESRLRCSRSSTNPVGYGWTTEEALAFNWFATANDCFEALDASSPRARSAAHFALDAIGHVRRDHVAHLGKVEKWRQYESRAYFFCPVDRLGDLAHRFFFPGPGFDGDRIRVLFSASHRQLDPVQSLSDRAVANLLRVRPREFALHEHLEAEFHRRFD